MASPRTPDQILVDFDAGASGQDIDMRGVLHEVIADILDTVECAMRDYDDSLVNQVMATTRDYVANHYSAAD